MVYMIVYIKFQFDADDAEEMSGGIIPLVFAGVEFCRAVVGLWQPRVFTHWVAASVRSLVTLGYVPEDDGHRSKDDADVENGEDGDTAESGNTVQDVGSWLEIADNLIMNDLVEDNRLHEGEVECTLRLRNRASDKNWDQKLCSS